MTMNATEARPIARLLIVDDDPTMVSQLRLALSSEFEVYSATDTDAGWKIIQRDRPDLVTLDLAVENDDPETGFSLLEKCLSLDPTMKIVLITGNDQEANALRAVEQGAADFFGKPVDIDELRVLLRRLAAVGRLERQNAKLLVQQGVERRLGAILGQSPSMRSLFGDIEKVAGADVAVLVRGESGTGKELVAREIRRMSSRATKPFVSINCAAIPENLLEAELFGHEKGAFTGAHQARMGKLEMAQGGIVFLDEIGELPMLLQVKLLRFLQEHEIERIGGRCVINLDVRVLAATSRTLEEEVRKERFREDLYYRLSVVNLRLPPLRERREDILLLAQYFVDRFANEFRRGRLILSADARAALLAHAWPGNVRELENKVQKAVVMCSGRQLNAEDFELEGSGEAVPISLREAREQVERSTISEALRRTSGNISNAARILGISRPSLHELITKRGINANQFRKRGERAEQGNGAE